MSFFFFFCNGSFSFLLIIINIAANVRIILEMAKEMSEKNSLPWKNLHIQDNIRIFAAEL